MPDPTPIAVFVHATTGQFSAVKLASDDGYLDCCRPVPIPGLPTTSPALIADLRALGRDDQDGTLAAYTEAVVLRSSAISENENRLRGVLWCYRQLRAEYAKNREETMAELGKRVRNFIAREWGIGEPPTTYGEANKVAQRVVAGMVKP